MRVKIKGRLLCTEYIWFESFSSKKEIKSNEPRVCIQANPAKLSKNSKLQHTLVSRLDDMDTELLINTFSSTVRNEIRRAERDGVECKVFTSNDLAVNHGMIDAFADTYREMYAEKGLNCSLEMRSVEAYIKNNVFVLTVAYVDGKPCVFHSYVVDDTHSRLLHSCSKFRVQDNSMKNSIGRANKLLHYKDMQYLSGLGIISYDWGGISSFEKPNGIDKFKMSFGGTPVDYYNCFVNLSLKAKLISIYNGIFARK